MNSRAAVTLSRNRGYTLKPTSKTEAEDPANEPRGGETQWQQSVRMLAIADRQLEDLREQHRAANQRLGDLQAQHHDATQARRYAEAQALYKESIDAQRAAGVLEQQIAMLEMTRRSHAAAVDFWKQRERLRTAGAPGASA